MRHNKSIYGIAWLFIALFIGMTVYVGYFTVKESKQIAVHPYNRRLDHLESEVIRGTIYDAEGNVLATTEEDVRRYPYGTMYAHAIGYSIRGQHG